MKLKRKNVTDSAAISVCKGLNPNYYKATFYGFLVGWKLRNKLCQTETVKSYLVKCLAEYYDAFGFPREVLHADTNGYPYSLNSLYKEVTSWHTVENNLDEAATTLHLKDGNSRIELINELGTLFYLQLDVTISNLFLGFKKSNPTECDDVQSISRVIELFEHKFKFFLEEIDYLLGREKVSYYEGIITRYDAYESLRSNWNATPTVASVAISKETR